MTVAGIGGAQLGGLGFAACMLCCTTALMLAMPIALLVIGVRYQNDICTDDGGTQIPLAKWAIAQGAVQIGVLPILLCFMGAAVSMVSATTGCLGTCLGFFNTCVGLVLFIAITVANLALLIWGSVLAWSNNRFSMWQSNDPNFVCPNQLYQTCVIILIINWVTFGCQLCGRRGSKSSVASSS